MILRYCGTRVQYLVWKLRLPNNHLFGTSRQARVGTDLSAWNLNPDTVCFIDKYRGVVWANWFTRVYARNNTGKLLLAHATHQITCGQGLEPI